MLRPSKELEKYIDFDDGKLVVVKTVPLELTTELENFKKAYEEAHNKEDLADY